MLNLYKGIRPDTQKWITGYARQTADGRTLIHPLNLDLWIAVIPETLCQATGMPDASGNMIFENDIVDCNARKHCFDGFVVKWLQSECRFVIIKEKEERTDICPISDSFKYKITGNIFDLPIERKK